MLQTTSHPNCRAAAIELATRLGWPILPLNGKVPATAHGCKDATNDAARLERLIRPGQNIGLRTGGATRVFVLDLDVRPGKNGVETLAQLEVEHEPLPPTPRVRTGGGGEHVYLLAPEGTIVGNSVGTFGAGIDVRGEGVTGKNPAPREPALEQESGAAA